MTKLRRCSRGRRDFVAEARLAVVDDRAQLFTPRLEDIRVAQGWCVVGAMTSRWSTSFPSPADALRGFYANAEGLLEARQVRVVDQLAIETLCVRSVRIHERQRLPSAEAPDGAGPRRAGLRQSRVAAIASDVKEPRKRR
jgi:hypothetical protein